MTAESIVTPYRNGKRSLNQGAVRELVPRATQTDIASLFAITSHNAQLRHSLLRAILELPLETWQTNRLEPEEICKFLSDNDKDWLLRQYDNMRDPGQSPLIAFIIPTKRIRK